MRPTGLHWARSSKYKHGQESSDSKSARDFVAIALGTLVHGIFCVVVSVVWLEREATGSQEAPRSTNASTRRTTEQNERKFLFDTGIESGDIQRSSFANRANFFADASDSTSVETTTDPNSI